MIFTMKDTAPVCGAEDTWRISVSSSHFYCKSKTVLMGWEAEGRFKREGLFIYQWLIHVDIWQKPTQYCKAIILQLKQINK